MVSYSSDPKRAEPLGQNARRDLVNQSQRNSSTAIILKSESQKEIESLMCLKNPAGIFTLNQCLTTLNFGCRQR